jgi:CDGSH-type Zn-finger protein
MTGDAAGEPGPAPRRQLPPDALTIRCRRDGPLVVEMPTGDQFSGLRLRVTDHADREFCLPPGNKPVALCRCGRSGNRPFCDGTHKTVGFTAAEEAAPDATPPHPPA